MGPLLALVFLLSPGVVGGQSLSARITVSSELTRVLPPLDALQSGLQRHFARCYGALIDMTFGPGAQAAEAEETATVTVEPRPDALSVSTDLARGSRTVSMVSTVPLGAMESLLSTMASDIAFLHFSLAGLSALPLSTPPPMAATVQTDTLAGLTSWGSEELEPIGLCSAGNGGVTVCFPHRYLTLGPSFRITDETIRDLNQQASGHEPSQISGVAHGANGEIILLSEREGVIVRLDPRLGTRQTVSAPGLSSAGARMIGPDLLAVLSNAPGAVGLDVFSFSGAAPRRHVPILASYVSAFSRDTEGNFWAWDAQERRIRVVTPAGQEVYSIRPFIGASTMQLPQQLDVFDDGSFLLGGSGEVWKFQNTGMPSWRLTRFAGRPGEQLPSSFALAANGADGSFFLLDAPSRRLVMFSPSLGGFEDAVARALGNLNTRQSDDLRSAAGLARQAGLSLLAWQLGDQLAKRNGPLSDRMAGRVAVLRERTERYADLADSLERDLLFDRADAAYARATDSARELTGEWPADQEGTALLQRIVSHRQEMRAAFTRKPDIRVVAAAAEIRRVPPRCGALLVVKVGMKNAGATTVTGLRIHVSAPPLSASPALSILEKLAPGQEREVDIPLELSADARWRGLSGTSIRVATLVTYQKGREGVAVRASLDIPLAVVGTPPSEADMLACAVVTGDQATAGLADELLAGPGGQDGPRDPVAAFAAIMDSLGSIRAVAARGGAGAAAGAAAAGAAAGAGGATGGARQALRGLSADPRDWTLLTLCTAATLGIPIGTVSWQDRAFALVDTGIARAEAVSAVPGLLRYAAVLDALARGDTLCVPLSGSLPPDPGASLGWAVADALRECAKKGMASARAWWRDAASSSGVGRPVPMPFPLPLPAVRIAPSRDTLRAEIIESLEQDK